MVGAWLADSGVEPGVVLSGGCDLKEDDACDALDELQQPHHPSTIKGAGYARERWCTPEEEPYAHGSAHKEGHSRSHLHPQHPSLAGNSAHWSL
eukprot:5666737-Amphidinium_carterae.1